MEELRVMLYMICKTKSNNKSGMNIMIKQKKKTSEKIKKERMINEKCREKALNINRL